MEALRFSTQKFLSFFSAPLIPFAGVALVTILLMLGGFLFLIPWVGEFLASVLWPLPLLGGLVMALMLIGLVGWPLMYATISTEGSDSFDALSRCYAYVFQRPWHYVFYSLVAFAYGVLVIFFVVFVTSFFVHLAKWGVGLTPGLGWRATGDPVTTVFYYAPESYDWQRLLLADHAIMKGIKEQAEKDSDGKTITDPDPVKLRAKQEERYNELFKEKREQIYSGVKDEPGPKGAGMTPAQVLAALIVAFWLHLVFLLMLGFAYSYYWSASTIIYFLLRKRVDDTDVDEIYLEEEEEGSLPPSPTAPSPPLPPPAALPTAPPPPIAVKNTDGRPEPAAPSATETPKPPGTEAT
jgi:hypothetical protein